MQLSLLKAELLVACKVNSSYLSVKLQQMCLIGSTQNWSMRFAQNKLHALDYYVCLIIRLYCSSIWRILMGLDIMNRLILINCKVKLMLTKQPLVWL